MAKKKFLTIRGKKATINVMLIKPKKEQVVDEFIFDPPYPGEGKKLIERINFRAKGWMCGFDKAQIAECGKLEFNIYCNADSGNLIYLIPALNAIVDITQNGNSEAYWQTAINIHIPDYSKKEEWMKIPLSGIYSQEVVDNFVSLYLDS